MSEAELRRAFLAILRAQAEDRRRADAHARRGKECPIQRPMRGRLF